MAMDKARFLIRHKLLYSLSRFPPNVKRSFASAPFKDQLSKRPLVTSLVSATAIGAGVIAFTPSLRNKFINNTESSTESPSESSSSSETQSASADSSGNVNINSQPIEYLPDEIPYLLIGGGTATFAAIRAIRVRDPKSKILVISGEKYKPYMKPPLSKEIWYSPTEIANKLTFRQYNGNDKSIFFDHDEFYHSLEKLASKETGGVSVVNGIRVNKVDTTEQVAHLSNGQTIKFGKCLLATGGELVTSELFNSLPPKIQEDRIIYYRTADDFIKLNNIITNPHNRGKNITIIGGQFLGTELAASLGRRMFSEASVNFNITQIVEGSGVLSSVLPDYLSKFVTLKVLKEGPNVITETQVTGASMINDNKNERISLTLSNGSHLTSDFVVIADPVVNPNSSIKLIDPNATLAAESNLEIHPTQGGFVANSKLQINSNVYTAGDAANYYDVNSKDRKRGGHHDFAIGSGRQAGKNMTGQNTDFSYFPFYWSDIGPEVSIEAVGDTNSAYETTGVFLSVPISQFTYSLANSSSNDKKDDNDDSNSGEINDNSNENNNENAKDNDEDLKFIVKEHPSKEEKTPENEYERGVVFYYKDKKLVGILMINLFNKVFLSRLILKNWPLIKDHDANEIAKLYRLYSIED